MKTLILITIIAISNIIYSQNENTSFSQVESEIIQIIINDEIKNDVTLHVKCSKPKTYFNAKELKDQTGLNVPPKILESFSKTVKNSVDGVWDTELLKHLTISSVPIKSINCLTDSETKELFEKTKMRQTILTISQPVFDNERTHCIASISYSKFLKSAYGKSYLLKKIYGKWIILGVYDLWII